MSTLVSKQQPLTLWLSISCRFPVPAIPQAKAGAHRLLANAAAQAGARLRGEPLRSGGGAEAVGPGTQPDRNAGEMGHNGWRPPLMRIKFNKHPQFNPFG